MIRDGHIHIDEETQDHLFIHCPFATTLWLRMKWPISLELMSDLTVINSIKFMMHLCVDDRLKIPIEMQHGKLQWPSTTLGESRTKTWKERTDKFYPI